jgi:hypothetical protein
VDDRYTRGDDERRWKWPAVFVLALVERSPHRAFAVILALVARICQ